MSREGVIYVAIAANAEREQGYSAATLAVHSDRPVTVVRACGAGDNLTQARRAKVNLDTLSPYAHTLYLDADTRIRGDLSAGFDALADGWDVVMTASGQQGPEWLWHVTADEREATLIELGYAALQLQCGVLWFAANERVRDLFAAWRAEWARWQGPDQGAFLRAVHQTPVKVWLMGRDWNGGQIVEHRFGAVRR